MAYICSTPKCPAILDKAGKCPAHCRAVDKARGSRNDRGYGIAHDKLRAQWAPKVAAGTVECWRCLKLIASGTPWDLGHDDTDRAKYRGPEHAHCNQSAGGKLADSRWRST